MRVFKVKECARQCRRLGIEDAALRGAVEEIEAGKIDAALGGEVYKQRIARRGQGKSGGYRAILIFRLEHRAVFMHAFAKNVSANISDVQLRAYKRAAMELLGLDDAMIDVLLENGVFVEVM